ncbi:unnamed protein product, partial [Brenthis ino]
MELEDIKLQIQIVNTVKITLRCSEFAEREQLLKQRVEEFHKVRARVREIIAVNEELRNVINSNPSDEENLNSNHVSEEEYKLIVELLKELKYDQPVRHETEKNNCCQNSGEPVNIETGGYATASEAGEPAHFEENEYASASGTDNKHDYNIKIAKVTIVYRVAYLRHYIKLRKGKSKLRKRMNNIKKLLHDWQKTLNMVINSNRLSMLNFDMHHNMEIAPQEAVEEFSKSNLHNLSDSDSDFRNSADDDYNMSWIQNHQYRPFYDYDNFNLDTAVARKCTDLDDCYDLYNSEKQKCQCKRAIGGLFMVLEETRSQVEIEKIRSDD